LNTAGSRLKFSKVKLLPSAAFPEDAKAVKDEKAAAPHSVNGTLCK